LAFALHYSVTSSLLVKRRGDLGAKKGVSEKKFTAPFVGIAPGSTGKTMKIRKKELGELAELPYLFSEEKGDGRKKEVKNPRRKWKTERSGHLESEK